MAPPPHLPTPARIAAWPDFTPSEPLDVVVSGCLAGRQVGYDGSDYGGGGPAVERLIGLPNVRATAFCPEHAWFGTPRALCDIHGGDGHDVLAGRARVLTADGEDWTDGMIAAARRMVTLAQTHKARLAVLMDISAACGSQVIYAGRRPQAPYRAGHGVCAAMLVEAGVPVVSQRDFKTLGRILAKVDPDFTAAPAARDHHEIDWYREYFGAG